jgi:RecB family exonuclease
VHHALERFFGLPAADRSQASLHNALRSVWRQHVKPRVFGSREEEAEYGRTALAMLTAFTERFDISVVPAAREQWVSKRLTNGVKVFGKIDRIDASSDGTLQVVDYKTGRRVLDYTDLPTESAVQVYVTATEASSRREVTRLRILYLAHGIEMRWEPEREDIETAEERLTALTDRIRADNTYEATPGPHCAWCPFRLVCGDSDRVSTAELVVPDDILF